MKLVRLTARPKIIPPLDEEFMPAELENRVFSDGVRKSGKGVPVLIALERANSMISTFKTEVFDESLGMIEENLSYIERLVKSLLWIKGGWKIIIGGPEYIGEYIKNTYRLGGEREFDSRMMSRIYEKELLVETKGVDNVPESKEMTQPVGRHINGCRIGFDAGGSDRKVAAVIDGKVVYSEEVVWCPKIQSDPDYHYNEIMSAIKTAASYMPKVDAIGVSTAGTCINNRIMSSSLFIKVPDDVFENKVKNMFINIQNEIGGIPLEIANDGDVTALAGAMDLGETNVLGIAMGTSEAGGYVEGNGNIMGWINELAFVPVDFNPGAAVDEWSGDSGCGVKYFSQDAVIRLAPAAGIVLDEKMTSAEKLKVVQELHEKGDIGAEQIFDTIGCYLGYAIAYYVCFYDIGNVLILGRVTSGKGGNTILDSAKKVLNTEYPELYTKISLHLPDETERRVGQSIAAASLPDVK